MTGHATTPWKALTTKPIYRSPWLSLREDVVEMPNGETTLYGVVTCGNCVGVLPFLDRSTVLLVQQYRYVAGRVTWEMPTGGVHGNEALEGAARRELIEETGYRADRLSYLCAYHTSKSVIDETAHLFMAKGLTRLDRRAEGDATEFIEVRAFPFERLLEMVLSGEITDSMTIIATLRVARER
jgi:8-oxo-dGTP pyrophosphatase MutT (NUDIX family)